ncbi:hypothetical protein [Oscillatoria sp. HE19RPO]|uniref:hypothetical protein n=1 Tax=Oscillatoria sp. HE19RPO TaxID=2954806 RepID=UPI0020C300E1|nr:hypothetical protein [Oscillatoria sp. HE19RPO]
MNNCNVEGTPAIALIQLNPIKLRSVPSPVRSNDFSRFRIFKLKTLPPVRSNDFSRFRIVGLTRKKNFFIK